MNTDTLRLTEIFFSLQGESNTVGIPTVFVRLTGCPLRCVYCDTEYAFHGGKRWHFNEIFAEIAKYNTQYITITGGEPLAQPNVLPLMQQLCDKEYAVSIETSGALSIEHLDPRVCCVMDLKTPSSGECEKNLYSNIQRLKPSCQVKFVIANRDDFDWSVNITQEYQLNKVCTVLFSPEYNQLSPTALADWIIASQLPVRFQTQLHKILWGDEKGK